MVLNVALPTVIIPAYNEEAVISKLLGGLQEGLLNGAFQVVVACNGCKDETVSIVRNQFPGFICLDIPEGSKINALNQAEALGLGYPRVYVDADVNISTTSILKLIDEIRLKNGPALFAPRAKINTHESTGLVRIFYSAWQKTTFFIDEGFGSGVYVLNQQAREQFNLFPMVIADDGFVREVLKEDQIFICEEASSAVEAPRTYRDLISIKTRSKLGNMQLKKQGMARERLGGKKRQVYKMSIVECVVYGVTNTFAQVLAKIKLGSIDRYSWQRDHSSRV